ncbi:MAG: SDR family NAD(P)-dependent oxidoreductase [Bacillota bacterium]|jgi:short-subunit dehydrogenase|nr:SDR family NAD(P)-dependent oxidoreductase [Bacillota bacterium]
MKDKICVVTGASSGLGKATAEILAKKEARIIMVSRKNERGEKSFKEIKSIGAERIEWIPTDLSSNILERAQSPQEGASHLIELAQMTDVNGKYLKGQEKD